MGQCTRPWPAKLGMQLTPNPPPLGEIELEWLVLRSLIQAVQDQLHFPIARKSARPVPFNCSISQIEKVSSPIVNLNLEKSKAETLSVPGQDSWDQNEFHRRRQRLSYYMTGHSFKKRNYSSWSI